MGLGLGFRVRVRGAARLDGLGVVLGDRVRAGLVRGRGRVRVNLNVKVRVRVRVEVEGEGEGEGESEVRAGK